jgi:hypothetical protein
MSSVKDSYKKNEFSQRKRIIKKEYNKKIILNIK